MIATVTLNPAIDYHISMDNFHEGKSLSATNSEFFAGGKGINVSRVLTNLGCESVALSFVGGFTRNFIVSQASDIIVPIPINDTNRINTKIKTSSSETEIHGVAPVITTDEFSSLCLQIQSIKDLDVLVLSGSIPPSLGADSYKVLASLCPSTTKIVIDTRGQALKECLSLESIFLIKPNKDEIGELFGCEIHSNEEALSYAQKLKSQYSIENIIVSLGAEGAYFLNGDDIYFAETLKGTLVSSVGSGDSVVAGFIAKYQGVNAFKYSIACGGGTAFSKGLCTLQTAESLYPKVIVHKIS